MRRATISSSELARRGWVRSDPRPRNSKLDAKYEHVDGWRLEHCGHQTAHHPWLLLDPKGRVVLAGAAGTHKRPDFGAAWNTLDEATEFVATLDRYEREHGLRWFDAHRQEVG